MPSDARHVVRGRAWKVGDRISGDDGILRFSELRNFGDDIDPAELAARCLAGVLPDFAARVAPGDVLVAGRGFGVPSHPPASVALRATGLAAVVADSTDSAFVRRSLNAGLPVLTCPGITDLVDDGDTIRIDLAVGRIRNETSAREVSVAPFAAAMLEIVDDGGLIPHLERTVLGGAGA